MLSQGRKGWTINSRRVHPQNPAYVVLFRDYLPLFPSLGGPPNPLDGLARSVGTHLWNDAAGTANKTTITVATMTAVAPGLIESFIGCYPASALAGMMMSVRAQEFLEAVDPNTLFLGVCPDVGAILPAGRYQSFVRTERCCVCFRINFMYLEPQ